MLVAVTERAARLKLYDKDLFVATVGGMRISDPATDLALCLTIASAGRDIALPENTAAIGEVTLSGDIRPAPSINQRISEALRLGYRRILAPTGTRATLETRLNDAIIVEVHTLEHAYTALLGTQHQNSA